MWTVPLTTSFCSTLALLWEWFFAGFNTPLVRKNFCIQTEHVDDPPSAMPSLVHNQEWKSFNPVVTVTTLKGKLIFTHWHIMPFFPSLKTGLCWQILVEVLNIKYQEKLYRGVTRTHADGQTGGQEEANSHFSHTTIPKTIKTKIIGDIKKMLISRRDREVCRLTLRQQCLTGSNGRLK